MTLTDEFHRSTLLAFSAVYFGEYINLHSNMDIKIFQLIAADVHDRISCV